MTSRGSIVPKGNQYMWTYQREDLFLYGYADTMEEAQQELENADSTGIILVDDCFNFYMKNKADLKPLAHLKYTQLYRSFIQPSIGFMDARSITSAHLQALLSSLSRSSTSPLTVDGVFFILSSVFRQACRSHMIDANPMTEVEPPHSRKKQSHRSSFPEEELEELLRRADHSDFSLIFRLASWTGMRIGEILGLRWEDIDFERHVIHVCHNLEYVNRGYYLGPPKTETSIRTIPISEEHLGKLQEWKENPVCQERIQRAGDAVFSTGDHGSAAAPPGDTDSAPPSSFPAIRYDSLVFLSRTGKPVKATAVSNCMRHIVAEMKSEGLLDSQSVYTFHSLRHTFATLCLLKGMTPKVLSTILGHSSPDITLRVYTHVSEQDERREMEKLGLL